MLFLSRWRVYINVVNEKKVESKISKISKTNKNSQQILQYPKQFGAWIHYLANRNKKINELKYFSIN